MIMDNDDDEEILSEMGKRWIGEKFSSFAREELRMTTIGTRRTLSSSQRE